MRWRRRRASRRRRTSSSRWFKKKKAAKADGPFAFLEDTFQEPQLLPQSGKAAAPLDHESLMELLWAHVEKLDSIAWLLPCCRFANGKEIQALLSERKA